MVDNGDEHWARQVLEKLALASLVEQQRRRRWSVFFKLVGFGFLGALLWMLGDFAGTDPLEGGKHTALVSLDGVISAQGEASAERIVGALQAAFEDVRTEGVVLRINSPGGSPVQAGIINDEIGGLRRAHPNVPLFAVVEDVCASGGYYVAAAADRIFVDKASVVGSIGVLMDGFGFTGVMDKLGVERRLLTAGENKGFLDPFSPQLPKHREHAQILLQDIHAQFIATVRKGRGSRLKETPEMFSGLMWTDAKSVQLGLADGFGSVESVARDVIKAETVRDFTQKQNFAERFAERIGTDAAQSLMNSLSRTSLR